MQKYICSYKRAPSVYPEHHLQIDFFFLKQFIAIKNNFIFLNCKVGDSQVVKLVTRNEFLLMKTPFYAHHNQLNSNVEDIESFFGGWKRKTGTENYTAY